MKKQFRNFAAIAIVALGSIVVSCKKNTDDPVATTPDACASAVFPTGEGDVSVTLTSPASTSKTKLFISTQM